MKRRGQKPHVRVEALGDGHDELLKGEQVLGVPDSALGPPHVDRVPLARPEPALLGAPRVGVEREAVEGHVKHARVLLEYCLKARKKRERERG